MTDEKYIRIGFLNDFHGEDSILISADIHGLLELEQIFNRLSKKTTEFELTRAKYVDQKFNIGIKMRVTEFDNGLKLTNNQYEWNLTKKKWFEFSQKITGLYRNGTYGHHYLDSESNDNSDLQVVLSLNEHDLNFWNELGIGK